MEPAKNDQPVAEDTEPLELLFQLLFERIVSTPQRLLLLDYDGTLAPAQSDPAYAKPYDGVRDAIDDILGGSASHVVVMTSRPARELLPLLGLRHRPEIWGLDGWERLLPNGEYYGGPFDAAVLRPIRQNQSWMRDIERLGAQVMRRQCGVAIYWHGLADDKVREIRDRTLSEWDALNGAQRLVWDDVDGGIEWTLAGRGKGYIVRTLLEEHFDAFTAYLGDGVTDEDAFSVLRGRGLGVLVRPQRRPTFADGWLRPPEELLEFLSRWRVYCHAGNE